MRTETINIYKFEELDESAQEFAIEEARQTAEFGWNAEYNDSLLAFCDCLGISVPNWEHERGQVFHFEEEREHWHETMRGRKLSEFDREHMPTGFCADCDLFYTFVDTWKATGSAVEGIESAFNAFFSAWQANIDHAFSDEGIREMIECNEWEFDENGSFY